MLVMRSCLVNESIDQAIIDTHYLLFLINY